MGWITDQVLRPTIDLVAQVAGIVLDVAWAPVGATIAVGLAVLAITTIIMEP